jgi:hypothetical protein
MQELRTASIEGAPSPNARRSRDEPIPARASLRVSSLSRSSPSRSRAP